MSHYVGIDLGTTNSAICSYDGQNVRIWKSPEQADVTPSAIYVDKRGNRYYGAKAYNQAPYNPNNSATLFKRFMGTSTKITLEASNTELTPEECSAEILKVLFGYLPEEIRNDSDVCTVITVPAAFNQMKKDATLHAAKLAGLGNVALMQEPVAAIMSVMKSSQEEGIFLIYDLGGGTFDVSIAENIRGKVNLLAHGGVEMCGGRDIDRTLFSQIVVPWLKDHFTLPDDLLINRKYKALCRIAQWATERAKIELSANPTATIALSEIETRTLDEDGVEVYLDIDITREEVDRLNSDLVDETIAATRDVLEKAGLTANDIQKIVFVGGPTNYKPLRDKVSFELAIPSNFDVNPMTAVAEGASIFAESIDWSTSKHNRKQTNELIESKIDLSFKYTARTSAKSAKLACSLRSPITGYTIRFVCLENGWESGSAKLTNNLMFNLPLAKDGENRFEVFVMDESGNRKDIGVSEIVVTRTLATIGAIPASHSIGVEVIDKLGGTPTLEFLVSENDALPKKGTITFKAGQTLKAGSSDSINIKLWEGDIQYPIDDNRFIGMLKINGTDFEAGVIPTGAEIICDYEMSDSGTIDLEVSIPCIAASFTGHNFYSRQEGQTNLSDTEGISNQGESLLERVEEYSSVIHDPQLDIIREKAEVAASLSGNTNADPEDIQKANNELLTAKKLLNKVRNENLQVIRQKKLDEMIDDFDINMRDSISAIQAQTFDDLCKTAQRAINNNSLDFDNIMSELNNIRFEFLFTQDWFIIGLYQSIVENRADYVDLRKFEELKHLGDAALARGDINELFMIIRDLFSIKIHTGSDTDMFNIANIIKG